MRRTFILLVLFLSLFATGQITPGKTLRILNATTSFGITVSKGDQVIDLNTGLAYLCTAATASTYTLTTASANFKLLNFWYQDGSSNLFNYYTPSTTSNLISSTGGVHYSSSIITLDGTNQKAVLGMGTWAGGSTYTFLTNSFSSYFLSAGGSHSTIPLQLGNKVYTWDTGYLQHLHFNPALLDEDDAPTLFLSVDNNGDVYSSPATSAMIYPGVGVPISTGSAWGTSITGTNGQSLRFISGAWRAWQDSIWKPVGDTVGQMLYYNGSAWGKAYCGSVGNYYLKYTQSVKQLDLGCLSFYGATATIKPNCAGNLIFDCADGQIQFNFLGNPQWLIGSNALLPYTNNAMSIGSSTSKVANVYATTFQGALNGNAATVTNGVYKTDILCYAGCGIDSTLQKTTGYNQIPAGYSVGMVVDSVIFIAIGAASPNVTLKIWYGSAPMSSGTAVVTAGTAITSVGITRVSTFNQATIAKGNAIWVTTSAVTTACARIAILIYGHRS